MSECATITGSRDQADGVFPNAVNQRAFIDKIVLNVWGTMRRRPLSTVSTLPSRPIGGHKRAYARSVPFTLTETGSQGELRYGRLRPWKRLPPCRLVLRSVRCPLAWKQVDAALDALLRRGYRSSVSQLELTFDATDRSIGLLHRQLFTTARTISPLIDNVGRQTVYAGTPRSSWQLRLYEKTPEVVRIEYVLRRPILERLEINSLEDVLSLKHADLFSLASFREVGVQDLKQTLAAQPDDWRKQALLDWPARRPLQLLVRLLEEQGICTGALLQASKTERLLRRMQAKVVW